MTLHETEPVVMNDAGGGQVALQAGPTEVTVEKGVLTVHNNLTTLTLNVPKNSVKDLSKFTISGADSGQPLTVTGTRSTVDIDQNATPTTESCYQHDYFGERFDRRCESGRANVWRCAWGTRPVTHFSSTNTDEFTIRFTRVSDGHEVATFVARMDFTHSQGSSGGRCFVDFGRDWDICDYRCIAPPRPVVIVVDRPGPGRPPERRPDPTPGPGRRDPNPGNGRGEARPRPPVGHPGRPLPPPPETLPPPPAPIK
jgi:hypothetical protein